MAVPSWNSMIDVECAKKNPQTLAGCSLSIMLLFSLSCSTRRTDVIPVGPEAPESVSGPVAELGPETDPNTAIIKACSVLMSLPNAFIPVHSRDTSFDAYWRVATEYCAWQYSPDGRYIWTSLFVTSAIQNDPKKRKCALPANVVDSRYPGVEVLYLTIIHNHPIKDWPENKLSLDDVAFLYQMVGEHHVQVIDGKGAVVPPTVNGKRVPMRIIAFFGKRGQNGAAECAGFYEYTWGTRNIFRVTPGKDGRWYKEVVEFLNFAGQQ